MKTIRDLLLKNGYKEYTADYLHKYATNLYQKKLSSGNYINAYTYDQDNVTTVEWEIQIVTGQEKVINMQLLSEERTNPFTQNTIDYAERCFETICEVCRLL